MSGEDEKLRRRQVLAGTASSMVVGFAGCSGDEGGCDSGEVTVEGPDGTSYCVTPVERNRSVQEYYGYDRDIRSSVDTPDGLATNDAAVVFVYQDTTTGTRSLITILGEATTQSDSGGRVAVQFEGVNGYEWQAQDGTPGTGGGDQDPYQTPNGTFDDTESVLWGWNDNRTDGGAFGPLGKSFDITATLLAEGTVGGVTSERTGLNRVLVVDGADIESYTELATIEDGTGDISVQLSASGD